MNRNGDENYNYKRNHDLALWFVFLLSLFYNGSEHVFNTHALASVKCMRSESRVV